MSEEDYRHKESGDRKSEDNGNSSDLQSSSVVLRPPSPGYRHRSSHLLHPSHCPHLSILLYQPEIPQNTGNIARTCAATHTPLYLVEPLGFRITDKLLKRAGLDYWPHVYMKMFSDFETASREVPHSRMIYFSSHASRFYYDFTFRPGDCLVFGPETRGLPQELLANSPDHVIKIPIDRGRVRSLNLATSVGVALFEAIRQLTP